MHKYVFVVEALFFWFRSLSTILCRLAEEILELFDDDDSPIDFLLNLICGHFLLCPETNISIEMVTIAV